MTHSSVTVSQIEGFNDVVEVNNSSVLFAPADRTDANVADVGAVRLSAIGNGLRYRANVANSGSDQSLHGPFSANTCGVGVNLGITEAAAELVSDTRFASGEILAAITEGIEEPERLYGYGVPTDSSYMSVESPLRGQVFNGLGAVWDSATSRLTVPDGVYYVALNLQVRNGGSGTVRIRLVEESTGTEILRATDTIGSVGTVTNKASDWGPGSHTYTRLNGSYLLYVYFDTTRQPEGFNATVAVAEITPADPNAVVPAS